MTAVVLLQASAPAAASWVRQGVVPCHVAAAGRWAVVVPHPGAASAPPPYDDAVSVLLSRATHRLGPSIGAAVTGDTAVLTTQRPGFRTLARWAVRPRLGPVVRTPGLAPLRPGDLAPLSGGRRSEGELATLLRRRGQTAHEWLADVLGSLGLPGGDIIVSGDVAGPLVEPHERSVAAFASALKDVRP
ncbi:hypothetical protein GCM10022199_21420 [Marihabitans asiaticum]|uniref:Uncharacterized protein n=1 Tax=Marihabitans asiaticum TaxID=415218 RepID=A0A560WAI3_9MICO|nr:hypothetical protein [Marihabitans asiaticum]TWD14632.1 hypothetical protein FB557_2050 [Marihabitans asiaticum]